MSLLDLPTLEVDVSLRRSERRLAALAVVLAAVCPLLANPDHGLLLLGECLGAAGVVWAGFRRAGWLGGLRTIRLMTWRGDGRWLLVDGRGVESEAVLRSDTRVAAGVVWLRWNAVGVRSMLLTGADVSAPALRRLRARLRLTASASFRPARAAAAS